MTRKRELWSAIDPKHFEGKSLKQLQDRFKEALEFVERHPEFETGWHNEYRQELRRRIADKIGKKRE